MDYKEFYLRLGKAIYKIDNAYDEYAKNNKVTSPNALWVLYALNDGEVHSQKTICQGWSIPKTTINTIVKEFENEGYVTLSHIEGTRREMSVVLTESGKEYADKLLSPLYEREKEVLKKVRNYESLLKELESFASEIVSLGD